MLVLFDIDLTLLSSHGAGARAMGDAGRERFGDSFTIERTEFAGRLDPLIIDDLLRTNDRAVTPEHRRFMRDGYRRHLARRLSEPGACVALPGVTALLAALRARSAVAVGLLTGNFEDTGSMKLRAAGLEPASFEIAVWGDESPSDPPRREDLPPVGIRRFTERRGRALSARETIIIGDTPNDASCALAHGCRCLGVATGHFAADRLRASGFDRVVGSLEDVDGTMAWITGERP